MEKLEKYNPIKQELDVIEFWETNQIHSKANEKVKNGKPYYFLDGPPYTSGKIHLGIAWNKSLKDSILRYKRMQGFSVWDRAGYDMHGLPTELKVQAKLGLKHKDEIPGFGTAKFIEECKKFSVDNMKLMNKDFRRLGVWMDFENAYQSIQDSFIEGDWWLVKKADENKRLYEGEKVLHWCKDCATALAKHELEYKNVPDDSLFFKLKVKGKENEFLIIWTTTPWTIPFNMGVMANPELEYIRARVDNEVWILAKGLAGVMIQGVADKSFEILEEFKGDKLEGLKYIHPFSDVIDYSRFKSDKVHTVVMSDEYVDLSAGTGLVHMGTGCGPEDYEVGRRNGVPPFNNLDEFGVFPKEMGEFSGLVAKKDDKKITEALKKRKSLIAITKVEHDYAHCWRCKNPVIFRTTTQWFFKVEDMKEEMRKLNAKVQWIPDWAGNRQMDSWLNNLRDNGITRQRVWGTPAPIWKCKSCKKHIVVGSKKELVKLAGEEPEELHIPYIDEITIPCSCGDVMKRLPDVLDVWIDAGTTSWNCLDFPLKEDIFKKLYPADFILEGKDQIRGWFNLLFIASMVSMKDHSYKACYMHGFVNDALGRKMSKSLGNIISPYEVIDQNGADTLRFYSIGGANPGLDLNYNFDDMKVKRRNLEVLWNLGNYLFDYSGLLGINPSKLNIDELKNHLGTEERFILSKLNSTIKRTTAAFDSYFLNQVPLLVEELFLGLSRTYIQLIREKSVRGTDNEKKAVLSTLYEVLLNTLKLFAPIAPFISELIYQGMRKNFLLKEESIHLSDWPKHNEKLIDSGLESNFQHMEALVQAILSAREKSQLGVRWPLQSVVIETKDDEIISAVKSLAEIIKTQVNVKEIQVVDEFKDVELIVRPDSGKIGQSFRENSRKVMDAVSKEKPRDIINHFEKEGKFIIKIDGNDYEVTGEHVVVERMLPENIVDAAFRHGVVFLNKKMTPELEAEGFARELTRRVQSLRKNAGLKKTDFVRLYVKTEIFELLRVHEDEIKDKVGAEEFVLSSSAPKEKYLHSAREKVKGKEFEIFLK
ncbi:isoleucine--tRNA ligase [Candidatus Woesearchaeota archaeon]|nr:isoleucine--tRNA ligase [Candidatus Woesearchaeota archaeon]